MGNRCVSLDPTNISLAVLNSQNYEILHTASASEQFFLSLKEFVKLMKRQSSTTVGVRGASSQSQLNTVNFSENINFDGKLYGVITDDDERTHLIAENENFILIEYT